MADNIAGPGQGLPPPQALYPRTLYTTPFSAPTNRMALQSGQAVVIPAGTWLIRDEAAATPAVEPQWRDPVTGEWHELQGALALWGDTVRSDGFNFRLANISGVPTGANVTAGGSGYVASTTTVTPSAGGSTWRAVVGGALGAVTIVSGGANYTIPPQVFVQAPPSPGRAAVGYATITGGVVTGITWSDAGAGYTFPPQILIIPDPFDPVLLAAAAGTGTTGIVNATATVVLTGAGTVTAVLLVSAGAGSLAARPTLTIAGAGSGATATVLPGGTWVVAQTDTIVVQPASGA